MCPISSSLKAWEASSSGSSSSWRLPKENVFLGMGELELASAGLPNITGLLQLPLLFSNSDSLDSEPLVFGPSFIWTAPYCVTPVDLNRFCPRLVRDLPGAVSPLATMRRSRAAMRSARERTVRDSCFAEDVPWTASASKWTLWNFCERGDRPMTGEHLPSLKLSGVGL